MNRKLAFLLTSLIVVNGAARVAPQSGTRAAPVAVTRDDQLEWLERVEAMLADGRLEIGQAQADTMIAGREHERLEQHHRGVPVFGGQVVRQVDGRAVVSLFGNLYDGIEISVTPAIDAAAAASLAAGAEEPTAAVWGEPELGVLPTDEGYALTYRVQVLTGADSQLYFIDARTGTVALHYSTLKSQAAVGKGTGVLGDQKKVSASSAGGSFRASDALRPAQLFTNDFRGSLSRLDTFLRTRFTTASDIAVDSDNVWDDRATTDAHAYIGYTYDYFFKRYGRRGYNDRNGQIQAIVHPLARADASRYDPDTRGTFINNALSLGGGYIMFGDGDGRIFDYLAGALDVVAHEITHAVTDSSSDLVYRNEPGALNEAFSDIMAAGAEFFFFPAGAGALRADWTLGEDITRVSPGYIRSMQNPNLVGDPDHYSRRYTGTADNGGVHINSSIITHAFYLAVMGGRNRVSGMTVDGIGLANIDRMERIFYRGFVFMLVPTSNFSAARAATLQAAAELYGPSSREATELRRAWDAVGVS